MRQSILTENAKSPLSERLNYNVVLTLSEFVGVNLAGLEDYTQPTMDVPEEEGQPKSGDEAKFKTVSADLRKEIFTPKNKLQTVENF